MVRNVVASLNVAGASPSWVLYLLMRPWFPKGHPWYKLERFTLRDWHAHQTPLGRLLDVMLVAAVANLALFVALLVTA